MMKYYYFSQKINDFIELNDVTIEKELLCDNITTNTMIKITNDNSEKFLQFKEIKYLMDLYNNLNKTSKFKKPPITRYWLTTCASLLFFPTGIVAVLIHMYSINLYYNKYEKEYFNLIDLSVIISIFSIVLGAILLLIFYLNNYYITDIMYKY